MDQIIMLPEYFPYIYMYTCFATNCSGIKG